MTQASGEGSDVVTLSPVFSPAPLLALGRGANGGGCTFLLSLRTSWRYTNRALEDLKLMTFRLAALDVAILDAISGKLGLSSRADALRYAIRRTAEAENLEAKPSKAKPKRRQATP